MNEQRERTAGDVYEGIAFTFCKAATVALLFGRYALPAAALFCATFFCVAYAKGARETRCFLGPPLVVAAFWVVVAVGWGVWTYAREPLLALIGR